MSTRSQIAMLSGDDSIKSVYCHWDGYPAHNGRKRDLHRGGA